MRDSATLLSAVTSTGAGTAKTVERAEHFTAIIEATNVTAGATIAIQALTFSGNWVSIDSRGITANGNTVIQWSGAFKSIRANVTAYTDGTYTATLDAH